MEPKKVGRALGIGVRVASNMLRERVAGANAPQPPPVTASASPVTGTIPPAPPAKPRPVPAPQPRAAQSSKVANARRGARAFTRALLDPFTHAGSILWLEITGLFFGMFTLFFVQSIYRVHTAWRQGPERTHLLLYCGLAVVFAWFSGSSFLRAMRKSRRGPATRAQS